MLLGLLEHMLPSLTLICGRLLSELCNGIYRQFIVELVLFVFKLPLVLGGSSANLVRFRASDLHRALVRGNLLFRLLAKDLARLLLKVDTESAAVIAQHRLLLLMEDACTLALVRWHEANAGLVLRAVKAHRTGTH